MEERGKISLPQEQKAPRPPNTNNIVRVCVKVSRAEGPRRLHTDTAYAHLGVSACLPPKLGQRCLGGRPAEGLKVGV